MKLVTTVLPPNVLDPVRSQLNKLDVYFEQCRVAQKQTASNPQEVKTLVNKIKELTRKLEKERQQRA